jgi:N-acetylmuramoyl-L-alanine amidase
MASIAFANGFTWKVLWDHPNNAKLKTARKDPNLLCPGDLVHIPDLRPRKEACTSGRLNKFQVKNRPVKLRIQFLIPDVDEANECAAGSDPSKYEGHGFTQSSKPEKPRANVPYRAEIDGKSSEGRTDGNGFAEISISPAAQSGRIILNPGTSSEEVFLLKLGEMDPVDGIEGVKKRLNNLGYLCDDGAEITPEFEAALSSFQEGCGIPITGELDDATRDKLKSAHDGS